MRQVKRWLSIAAAALCARVGESDPVGAIRRCVDSLLADAGPAEPPVNIDLLASWRRVREIQHLDMVEAGRLVPEGGGYVVQVNRRHTEGKRRFTVGHEICHTFFDEATASTRRLVDAATGLFDIRQEEEYLCDVGAGHILLNPRWLIPMAQSRTASLDSLLDIARECSASIEATAFQLAQSGAWPCAFGVLGAGLSEGRASPPGAESL